VRDVSPVASWLIVSVVVAGIPFLSYCFQRTVVQSFAALFQFFGSSRLLKDVTHTVLTVTKIIRREMLTRLASETILGDVEPARHILRMLAWLITHEPLMSPFTAKSKLFDSRCCCGDSYKEQRLCTNSFRPNVAASPPARYTNRTERRRRDMKARGDALRFASRLPLSFIFPRRRR